MTQRMVAILILTCSWSAAQQAAAQATATPQPSDQADSELVIQNDSPLPDAYPHANYEFLFHAHGGVPALHWRVEKGDLPPGMKLDDHGLLHGQPEHAGEFHFTIAVRDNSQQAVQKDFLLRVLAALSLRWKQEARVDGNRIDGSAAVSNATPDDIDLTFIVLAVPPNGR